MKKKISKKIPISLNEEKVDVELENDILDEN
jgi:hypothetical protein